MLIARAILDLIAAASFAAFCVVIAIAMGA
jgi:hypothetical protein